MKVLVIVGPTSSGKTTLGLNIAKKFKGKLISADSRQVYKKLDIGTGKDLPKNAIFNFVSNKVGGYYLFDGVKVWGYDLVEPDKDFSVTNYIKFARNIIKHTQQEGKLPILVGGTGFYIKGVIDGLETGKVPRNENLRISLKNLRTEDLFENLAQIAPEKAGNMNISDKNNPRRLIRAIEVSQWKMKDNKMTVIKPLKADALFIGLKVDKKVLQERIRLRIEKRLKEGFDDEVEELLKSGVGWNSQSMQALGYRQWKDYLTGKISKSKAIEDWFTAEKKYAKKQMVWFKKDSRIKWIEQNKENWKQEMVQLVQEWIKKDENTKN